MEIRPILSALMRSKVAMILIGLQVALTLAIVCNALFIIGQRLEHMGRPSGMNESDTFWFGSNGFGQGYDAKVVQKSDLAVLRQLPGVADAAPTNSVPMSDGGWGSGLMLARAPEDADRGDDDLSRRRSRDRHVRHQPRRRPQLQARGDRIARFRRSPAAEGRDHLEGTRRQDVPGPGPDRQAGVLRSGSADDDDHRRRRSPAGAVDVEQGHRERDVRAGVHAVRQLDALSRAHRARPPRRSHEGGRAEDDRSQPEPHHRQGAPDHAGARARRMRRTARWRSSSAS